MEGAISKRQFLGQAGLGTALAAAVGTGWITPEATATSAAPFRASLAIFDSRLPESRSFAAQAKADGLRLFDIAGEEEHLWARARAGFGLGQGEAVAGMTRWSDWLIVRDLMHESGQRVRHEMRVDCCSTGNAVSYARLMTAPGPRSRTALGSERHATLFAWTMA